MRQEEETAAAKGTGFKDLSVRYEQFMQNIAHKIGDLDKRGRKKLFRSAAIATGALICDLAILGGEVYALNQVFIKTEVACAAGAGVKFPSLRRENHHDLVALGLAFGNKLTNGRIFLNDGMSVLDGQIQRHGLSSNIEFGIADTGGRFVVTGGDSTNYFTQSPPAFAKIYCNNRATTRSTN